MKVEFVERGPFETVVRVNYQFQAKPAIPRDNNYPDRSPGYPGGNGHYTCTIKVLVDQPSLLFEEDADVETSWRMNLLPELHFDTARHPQVQKNGQIKDVDWAVPFDADYTTGYLTQEKSIIHLMPWGGYLGEYYWVLFNSQGDDSSPVVGVFADKSGKSAYPDASGPGMVSSNNWLKSGRQGGGFNVQIGRRTPDARSFPFVRLRWGLYIGVKSSALAPLGKPQPIVRQMNLHGEFVLQLRNVAARIPELPRLNWEQRSDWINVKTKVTPPAVGDGLADDTAALQAALDGLKDGYDTPNTVYLPPGTYRITRTLRWKHLYGKRIIGHGRDTRICLGRGWQNAAGDVPQQRRHQRRALRGHYLGWGRQSGDRRRPLLQYALRNPCHPPQRGLLQHGNRDRHELQRLLALHQRHRRGALRQLPVRQQHQPRCGVRQLQRPGQYRHRLRVLLLRPGHRQ